MIRIVTHIRKTDQRITQVGLEQVEFPTVLSLYT